MSYTITDIAELVRYHLVLAEPDVATPDSQIAQPAPCRGRPDVLRAAPSQAAARRRDLPVTRRCPGSPLKKWGISVIRSSIGGDGGMVLVPLVEYDATETSKRKRSDSNLLRT